MRINLPNFLIVGAAKCGTSSLHNYLNQHPDIFMPSFNINGINVKEPQFLIKNKVKDRIHFGIWLWEEYKSLFEGSEKYKAIGESTVFYLYYYQEAIQEIKNRLGDDVRIIIMLRNPIDRAYSAYQHVSKSIKEQHRFEYALKIEEGRLEKDLTLTPMVMYKGMGMYYNMVKAYLESFKDVHIVLYDDFSEDTEKAIKKVFKFLRVNENCNIQSNIRYNVGGKIWRNQTIKELFIKESKLKSAFQALFSKRVREKIRDTLRKPFIKQTPPMKAETRDYLIKYFAQDIKQLSTLINKDLTNWTK